jgi:hypothetical protein
MRIQHVIGFCFFLAISLVLAGCGDGGTEVTGIVKYDGNPVEEGSITFTPVDGKTTTGSSVIKAGKYSARVSTGMMKVSFTYPKLVGKRKAYDTPDSPEVPEYKDQLADKYGPNNSDLKFEVKSGLNKKDWDLSSK